MHQKHYSFEPQSEHLPKMQIPSPAGACMGDNQLMLLFHIDFFFPFSKYILLIILSWLSHFIHLCPQPPNTPHSLRQSPHHCSCLWIMHISSLATPFPILYITPLWLFSNYLLVLLSPLTFSPNMQHSPPIWQPSKYSPCP